MALRKIEYQGTTIVWKHEGFQVRLSPAQNVSDTHKQWDVLFTDKQWDKLPLFTWSEYSTPNFCSPIDAIEGILSFITLQEGDTDREYFDKYTPRQMEWTRSPRCQELGIYAHRLLMVPFYATELASVDLEGKTWSHTPKQPPNKKKR